MPEADRGRASPGPRRWRRASPRMIRAADDDPERRPPGGVGRAASPDGACRDARHVARGRSRARTRLLRIDPAAADLARRAAWATCRPLLRPRRPPGGERRGHPPGVAARARTAPAQPIEVRLAGAGRRTALVRPCSSAPATGARAPRIGPPPPRSAPGDRIAFGRDLGSRRCGAWSRASRRGCVARALRPRAAPRSGPRSTAHGRPVQYALPARRRSRSGTCRRRYARAAVGGGDRPRRAGRSPGGCSRDLRAPRRRPGHAHPRRRPLLDRRRRRSTRALPLPERFEVPARDRGRRSSARARAGGRVVAVGTTVVRALEGSAALHGGVLRRRARRDRACAIGAGYRPRVVDGLLTGLHEPGHQPLRAAEARSPPRACSGPRSRTPRPRATSATSSATVACCWGMFARKPDPSGITRSGPGQHFS